MVLPLSATSSKTISLSKLDTYETGIVFGNAAEIVAYDSDTQRIFVTTVNPDVLQILQ